MGVHDFLHFSFTLSTAITTFFVMQYVGFVVVRYFNS